MITEKDLVSLEIFLLTEDVFYGRRKKTSGGIGDFEGLLSLKKVLNDSVYEERVCRLMAGSSASSFFALFRPILGSFPLTHDKDLKSKFEAGPCWED